MGGFPEGVCGNGDVVVLESVKGPPSSASGPALLREEEVEEERLVTWLDLLHEDLYLTAQVVNMTLAYGYQLDPRAHPQVAQAKAYRAG